MACAELQALCCSSWLSSALYALTGAGSTRVSNALGGQRPDAARVAALAVVVLAAVNSSALGALIFVIRKQVGLVFSDDPEVIAMGAGVLRVMCFALLGDSVNCALAGALATTPIAMSFQDSRALWGLFAACSMRIRLVAM